MARSCPHCGGKLYISTSVTGAPYGKNTVAINVETAKAMLMRGISIEDIARAFQVDVRELEETLKRFGVKL